MKNVNKLSFVLIAGIMLFASHASFAQDENVLPTNETPPPPPRVLSESEHQVSPSISLGFYPNPCNDRLTVELENPEHYDRQQVNIYSLTGKTVWSGTIHHKQPIDVSAFNPGIYIVSCDGASAKFQKI